MELRDRRILAKMRTEAQLAKKFVDDMDYDGFTRSEVMKRAVAQKD
jgi:uncharacterized protein with HEPN domain